MTIVVRWHPKGWWQYDIQIVYPNGESYRERRKAPVSSESGSRKWAEQRESHLLRTWSALTPRGRSPLFEKFAVDWIEKHARANQHKPTGIAHKEQVIDTHLLPIFKGRAIDTIGAVDIAELKQQLAKKGRKPKTINNVLVVLSKMLNTAVEWEVLAKAPRVQLLKIERRSMPFYEAASYDKLILGARKVHRRAVAAILLAGDAGLRRGEILALGWADVDLERRIIFIRRSLSRGFLTSTKGNTERAVPMTGMLHAALSTLVRDGERVIKGVTEKALRWWVTKAEKIAGLPPTGRLHVLRHTYASHLAMAGESLYQLQHALGHKDSGTTQGYAHVTAEALRPLAAAIDARRRALLEPGNIQETTDSED